MLAVITWKHLVIAGLIYLIGFMHGVWEQEKEEKRTKKVVKSIDIKKQ